MFSTRRSIGRGKAIAAGLEPATVGSEVQRSSIEPRDQLLAEHIKAALAQLGERQTEDLKVPGSILGLGISREHLPNRLGPSFDVRVPECHTHLDVCWATYLGVHRKCFAQPVGVARCWLCWASSWGLPKGFNFVPPGTRICPEWRPKELPADIEETLAPRMRT